MVLLEAHGEDHVATALPRRHGLEQRLAAVEHADAGGAVQLVAGEGIEIAIERLHVDALMRHRLRAIEQHRYPARVRKRNDLLHRQNRAEGIRDVRRRYEPGARGQPFRELLERHLAAQVDRCDHELRTARLAEHFDTARLRKILKNFSGKSLMVVGHEPDFTRTIFQLTGGKTKLPKTGVALVELEADSMKGELRWLVPPKFAKE